MTGTVEVVAPGTPGITTQEAVDAQQVAMDAMRQSQAGGILASRSAATRVEGPRGADLWFVRAGTGQRSGNLDIQAFLPGEVSIAQGDTVVWYADNVQHHTVTFRPIGVPNASADLFQVQMAEGTTLPRSAIGPEIISWFEDPINPARLVFGPGARKTTNPIHDGRNLFTSGIIGEHPRIAVPMDKVWALTFNTPGFFQYVCLIREDQGMTGTVSVRPR
jgi:plastocyanin